MFGYGVLKLRSRCSIAKYNLHVIELITPVEDIEGIVNVADSKEQQLARPFLYNNAYHTLRRDRVTMWSILPLLSLSALLVPVQSLYFYIDGSSPKCFFEELPKDTLVVGKYVAEEWDENLKSWAKHEGLNIFITVDVRLLCFKQLQYRKTNSDFTHRKCSTTTTEL